nr:transposase, MuDR, MULE transposase domain protein [Tanacetum cinerariifolium]
MFFRGSVSTSKRFSICGYDAMLDDLGIKDGSNLFSYFRIPRKSLDERLVPLISHKDVLSLLKYVPRYKEIDVYVEKHTMEVVSGKGNGVVIEEIMEDNEVNEASVDASVIALKEQLERIELVVDEDIERPRKRKERMKMRVHMPMYFPLERSNKSRKLNPAKKAEKAMKNYVKDMMVQLFVTDNERYFKLVRETYVMCQELIIRCQERREQIMKIQRFLSGSNVVVESFKLLKELQDDELDKYRKMMKLISETQLKVLKKISFIAKLHH